VSSATRTKLRIDPAAPVISSLARNGLVGDQHSGLCAQGSDFPKDFAGLWWWDGNFTASYWFSKRYAVTRGSTATLPSSGLLDAVQTLVEPFG
jgi:hypothetical protein